MKEITEPLDQEASDTGVSDRAGIGFNHRLDQGPHP
jgi:hypothetical protein